MATEAPQSSSNGGACTHCCGPPVEVWNDVYGGDVRPRRNGFECPLDPLQVGAWGTIVALIVLYFTLHAPFFTTSVFIGVTIPLLVLALATISLKLYLSSTSNEEPIVFDRTFQRLDLYELSLPPSVHVGNSGRELEPCFYCRGFVSKSAKHCSVCDKCIPGFDHHCRWLNTCVGEKNYRPFFLFVCSAIVSVTYVLAVDLYVLVDAIRYRSKYEALLNERYNTANYGAYIAFLAITLAYTVVGVGAMGNLLQFHIYLWWTNQTTYQWILNEKEKKRRKGEYQSTAGSPPSGAAACCEVKKRRFFKKRNAGSTSVDMSSRPGAAGGGRNEPVGSTSTYAQRQSAETETTVFAPDDHTDHNIEDESTSEPIVITMAPTEF